MTGALVGFEPFGESAPESAAVTPGQAAHAAACACEGIDDESEVAELWQGLDDSELSYWAQVSHAAVAEFIDERAEAVAARQPQPVPGQAHEPGATAYSLWAQVMAANGVDCEPFGKLGNVEQMAWREVEARQPQPALATVDLHRWYAVISQPNGMTKVIGHTSDGLGYYDSVDEWEAKNS
jgi:hypothetical protein